MSVPVQIVAVYFILGLVVLILFELITKRLSANMLRAGTQAQIRMAEAGSPIGPKVGRVLILTLTWIFWPMVLIGALKGPEKEQPPRVLSHASVIGAGTRVQMSYLLKKIWYGECPDCHVVLMPLDAWGQYSICPVCKTEFKGIRMKAKKGDNDNGKSETITPGEGSGETGTVNSGDRESKETSVQPGGPSDFEAS